MTARCETPQDEHTRSGKCLTCGADIPPHDQCPHCYGQLDDGRFVALRGRLVIVCPDCGGTGKVPLTPADSGGER